MKRHWFMRAVGVLCGFGLVLDAIHHAARAAYASDFTLTNHVTGQATRLSDFAGFIVVLDFFSPSCTACQTATPDIHTNIHQYYFDRAGNGSGLPVKVIAINESSDRPLSDAFIASNHLDLVLDDPAQTVLNQFAGGLPFFAVINLISNNVNYPPWQILGRYYGYDAALTVPTLRGWVEAVRGKLSPTITEFRLAPGPVFTAQFTAQKGRTNWIEATTNWVDWIALTNLTASNTVPFFDPGAALAPRRFYRVRVE